MQEEKDRREKMEAKNKKELKELDTAFNRSAKALDHDLRAFEEEQVAEASIRHKEFTKQKNNLTNSRKPSLRAKAWMFPCLHNIARRWRG